MRDYFNSTEFFLRFYINHYLKKVCALYKVFNNFEKDIFFCKTEI